MHAEDIAFGDDRTVHELQKKLKGTPANSKTEVLYPVMKHDACCISR